MVKTDAIEGLIDERWWFHYDVAGDVLYIRAAGDRQAPVEGEESEDGAIRLYETGSERMVGLTIVNWWKRFGEGGLPDSLRQLEVRIEPWARQLAA